MLYVATEIGPSTVEGANFGLFAAETIPREKIVWQYVPGIDGFVTVEHVPEMPVAAQRNVRENGYLSAKHSGRVVFSDRTGFIQHSDRPNILPMHYEPRDAFKAARDIEAGEEIFADYFSFDQAAAEKLGHDDMGQPLPPTVLVAPNRFTGAVEIIQA